MKRIVFLILLLVSTGCKILQHSESKVDRQSKTQTEVSSEDVVRTAADTVADTSKTAIKDTLQSNKEEKALHDVSGLTTDSIRTNLVSDSTVNITDSIPADSILTDSVQRKKGVLEAPVDYTAKDSIVWTAGNKAYLYGDGDVKYQDIELKSETIEMSMDSSVLYATHGIDSIGDEFGYPVFTQGEQSLEAKDMHYNFKTRKAAASNVVTQQGEGYVIAAVTKKTEDDVMNMQDGKYTTCDDHEHPHFYIKMTKAKVRPGRDIVTGPAYLVVEDVPLFPLVLPFAFFPFTDSYSSGIIMPTYGDDMAQGFCLRNGGYYFALSDYFDFALTGEIYTKGSWGLSGRTSYRKRYKYNGSFDISYLVTKLGDKGLPDYSKSKAFKLLWSHTQDAKANPYRTFSANVNFSTNSYDRNQRNSLYTSAATQNNKGSSVNITQRFPNSPFSMSATMNINQRSQDSSVSVTLPDLTLTLSRIYPFKRKNPIGKERWYEKISMSYTGYFRNNINTKEDKLFKSNLVKDWSNAMQHTIPISATYTLFDYINISPSINYVERWYTHKIDQMYNPTTNGMMPSDTTYGFYRVFNYSASVSASTTVYGMFTPWKPFQKWVHKIRHRVDPSISFSATPDFGDPKYGFYQNYITTYPSAAIGGAPDTVRGYYSPFTGQLFGVPGRGKSGSVSFTLDNNIEAKIASERDSTGEKKISIIDKLSGTMSYNLAADSFQWSDLSTTLRLKLSKSYTLNLAAVFDTYTYDNNARRVNKPRWTVGKGIGRLKTTGTSFSYTFNNDTFKKLFNRDDNGDKKNKKNKSSVENDFGAEEYDPNDPNYDPNNPDMEDESPQKETGSLLSKKKKNDGEYDEDGYYNTNIPWSLSFSYSLSVGYGKFNPDKLEYDYKLTNSLSFNGSIQPTKNWRLTFNATYDFDAGKISYMTCNISRSMHCFQMSASIIPIGPLKSYTFSISANSSMLRDLKYDQSSNYRDGQTWY